jgi:hypothetical protein
MSYYRRVDSRDEIRRCGIRGRKRDDSLAKIIGESK